MKMAFCATVMECLHVLLLYTHILYIIFLFIFCVCVLCMRRYFFFFRKLPNARLGGARPAQAQSHVTGRFSWTANKQQAVQKKSEIEAARAAVCRRRRRRRHSPVELWFFSLFLFLFLFLLLLQLLFSSFILF